MLRLIRVAFTISWVTVLLLLWVVNTLILSYLWPWLIGTKPVPKDWTAIGIGSFDSLDYKKQPDGTIVRFAPWEWMLLALGTVALVATFLGEVTTDNLIASAIPFAVVSLSWLVEKIARNWEVVRPRLTTPAQEA